MQGLSSKSFQRSMGLRPQSAGFGLESGAVGRVAENRVPDMSQMHPDLVSTSRFQCAGQKARDRLAVGTRKTLKHVPISDGRPATIAHRLLVACMGVAAERRIDCALGAIRCAPDQSEVAALEWSFGLLSELLGEGAVSVVGLGRHHQAGCVLVE